MYKKILLCLLTTLSYTNITNTARHVFEDEESNGAPSSTSGTSSSLSSLGTMASELQPQTTPTPTIPFSQDTSSLTTATVIGNTKRGREESAIGDNDRTQRSDVLRARTDAATEKPEVFQKLADLGNSNSEGENSKESILKKLCQKSMFKELLGEYLVKVIRSGSPDKKEIEELLIIGANTKGYNGYQALEAAVSSNRVDLVQLLLQFGAEIDTNSRLLNYAVGNNNNVMVTLLLNACPKININERGWDHLECTPLMEAVQKNNSEMVQSLLKAGANPDIRGKFKWNALTLAVHDANKEIVELLIKGGANVHVTDDMCDCLLKKAIERGNKDIVQLLLYAGAKLKINTFSGKPSGYARGRFSDNIDRSAMIELIDTEPTRRSLLKFNRWMTEYIKSLQHLPDALSKMVSDYTEINKYEDIPEVYREYFSQDLETYK